MARPLALDSVSLTTAGVGLVTDADGVITPTAVTGLFVDDVRVVSSWQITLDAATRRVGRQSLGASADRLLFTVGAEGSIDPVGTFERRRAVTADGLREDVLVTTYVRPLVGSLRLEAARDDQPVFIVGDPAGDDAGEQPSMLVAGSAAGRFTLPGPAGGADVDISAPGWRVDGGALVIDLDVSPGDTWTTSLTVAATTLSPSSPIPAEPGSTSLSASPSALAALVARGRDDLAALTMSVDGRLVIAAGSPFFLALFGRDSLIAGIQALIVTPERLTDILTVLAAHQGRTTDLATRAQPGRIVHELRLGRAGVFGVAPGTPYYGAVDTAPLFVLALGEAADWGAPTDALAALLPAADAALEWCHQLGDVDGDGFIESVPHASGLINLGWKDSADSILDADGRVYVGPVALPEVQAYWYRALQTMARLEQHLGVGDGKQRIADAEQLAARFAAAFCYARDGSTFVGLGLDGDKRLLEVAASNAGHVLWSGILPPAVAVEVAHQLAAPDLFSGWGLRTLSSAAAGYNPFGYHRGSVWPHDTAIALHGAARYGVTATVHALSSGLVDLGTALGGQFPELVSGLDRAGTELPVPYGAACRPQAWAAGAPLVALRALLGLEPDVPGGVLRLHPMLPDGATIEVRRLRIGDELVSIRAEGGRILDVDSRSRVITGPKALLSSTDWCPAT